MQCNYRHGGTWAFASVIAPSINVADSFYEKWYGTLGFERPSAACNAPQNAFFQFINIITLFLTSPHEEEVPSLRLLINCHCIVRTYSVSCLFASSSILQMLARSASSLESPLRELHCFITFFPKPICNHLSRIRKEAILWMDLLQVFWWTTEKRLADILLANRSVIPTV